jgi:NADPH-dependent ferric siderophore reductase
MGMHSSTFEYLKPSDEQIERMAKVRAASADFAAAILINVPEGPDRTYAIRKHREVAMWLNVAITRHADGSPRSNEAA